MPHLNLIKNSGTYQEKRVLPRFPYCYLTFKCHDSSTKKVDRVFEVKDISHTGMQLALRDGQHPFQRDDLLEGDLHWLGAVLSIEGRVVWTTTGRLGVKFSSNKEQLDRVQSFLSPDNMVAGLRPLHQVSLGLNLPANLKYWLRADGPVEFFIWTHPDGEYRKFQVVLLENFIEWEDGAGLKTGRALSKRDINTPLIDEDEYVFEFDNHIDPKRITLASHLLKKMGERSDLLPSEVGHFLELKLNL